MDRPSPKPISIRDPLPQNHRQFVARLIVPTVQHPKFARIEERAMGKGGDEPQARAEAKFQKQQEADQAVKAERETQAAAVDVNTARLKSLRLAKEAAEEA